MSRDFAWVARYQFLEELWRGRDRILFDPDLEAGLRSGSVAGHAEFGPLLDDLVPTRDGEEQVWFVLGRDGGTAELARRRGGVGFVGLDDGLEVAESEPWEVAVLTLDMARSSPRTSKMRPSGLGIEGRLEPPMAALVEAVAEQAEDGRTVVLAVPIEDGSPDYAAFADLVDEQLPGAQLFGLAHPSLAAVYDLGQEDDEVTIDFDNAVGDTEPKLTAYLAVTGPFRAAGLSLIELPAATAASEDVVGSSETVDRDRAGDGLRRQLAEMQKQADNTAIERQQLLERLDDAERRAEELEDSISEGQHGSDESGDRTDGTRLDALVAREQGLRWEVSRLESELERLRARPVSELEAEVARLRSRLQRFESTWAAEGEVTLTGFEGVTPKGDRDPHAGGPPPPRAEKGGLFIEPTERPQQRSPLTNGILRAGLERLLQRVERGGLSTLALHAELKRLRARLR